MSYVRRDMAGVGERAVARTMPARISNWVVIANVLLMAATVALFVGYLAVNNIAATKGFSVRTVEKRISELREAGNRLDLNMVSMQTMGNIEQQVGELGFVPVDVVDYISGGPEVVAVK